MSKSPLPPPPPPASVVIIIYYHLLQVLICRFVNQLSLGGARVFNGKSDFALARESSQAILGPLAIGKTTQEKL